jgi:hypothetical protein
LEQKVESEMPVRKSEWVDRIGSNFLFGITNKHYSYTGYFGETFRRKFIGKTLGGNALTDVSEATLRTVSDLSVDIHVTLIIVGCLAFAYNFFEHVAEYFSRFLKAEESMKA